MSEQAVEQRPATDIFYDTDPFNYEVNIRYIQSDQKLNGIRDFEKINIPYEYFELLMDAIMNDRYMILSVDNSYFLRSYLQEILNRLCTEYSYVINVELHPDRYQDITRESVMPELYKWFYYAIEVCRYGTLNERMIDSVCREDIDIFMDKIIILAADRLVMYVLRHRQ